MTVRFYRENIFCTCSERLVSLSLSLSLCAGDVSSSLTAHCFYVCSSTCQVLCVFPVDVLATHFSITLRDVFDLLFFVELHVLLPFYIRELIFRHLFEKTYTCAGHLRGTCRVSRGTCGELAGSTPATREQKSVRVSNKSNDVSILGHRT